MAGLLIRHLHLLAPCPVPTLALQVTEFATSQMCAKVSGLFAAEAPALLYRMLVGPASLVARHRHVRIQAWEKGLGHWVHGLEVAATSLLTRRKAVLGLSRSLVV
jgi:hypothetical protein